MATLFDLDGTLLDPCGSIAITLQHLMDQHDFAPLDPEKEGLIGLPLRDILRRRTNDEAQIEAMVLEYREAFFAMGAPRVQEFAGVRAMLDQLAGPVGVVTTKGEEEAKRLLAQMNLADHFDVIIGDDDVRPLKPNPAPVLAACQQLGVAAQDATMVGDTRFDILAGAAAGTRTVAVSWGSGSRQELLACQPDHIVDSVAELRSLLGA